MINKNFFSFFKSSFLFSAFFALLFCFSFYSLSLNEDIHSSAPSPSTSASSPTPTASLSVMEQRSEVINKATDKTQEEKNVESSKNSLEQVQLEKQALSEINQTIYQEVQKLEKDLNIADDYKNMKSEELQKEIERKNLIIAQNQKAIEDLSAVEELRKYTLAQNVELKKELDEKNKQEFWNKWKLFLGGTLFFFLLYLGKCWFKKNLKEKAFEKKYAHFLNTLDIFLGFLYGIFLIWLVFHSNPSAMVYFLFILGGLVVALQEFIFSFIASIFLLQEYAVGDKVIIDGKIGIIERMGMLKIWMKKMDINGYCADEISSVSNASFLKQSITIITSELSDSEQYEVVFLNDLPVDISLFISRLEKEVLNPLLNIPLVNIFLEKKRFYHIDTFFTSFAYITIKITWRDSFEKNIEIKQKIAYLFNEVRLEAMNKK